MVDYVYRIGKHEVTNDQYIEFLNAVVVTDDSEAQFVNPWSSRRKALSFRHTLYSPFLLSFD